ncbi:HpcH/HpaI aldolase family protein [Gordonia sp. SL306]|uniref:HpcH/HpaI aldolase family protein n=1 Tax=Gordonia sp. SL306 TaxID=2995145 RepID=UPI00226F4438|nr:aldolase/citrate lyase family protein [Gordonia sp. SL306]WAC56816.1 aldolase/citrate lyase family protein [Gordonia sp. SL306]
MSKRLVAANAWISSDSRYAAEALSYAGFDSVTVDLQHGMFGIDTAVSLLQAISAGPAVPMVRCSRLDGAEIGKLLDAGAYGIICPSIDDAEQCRDFVGACRYPPVGTRSFGPSRGLLYGGPDYVDHANDSVLTWAMIESRSALDNLDEIAAVEGLDGIYIGPNDLAMSLGERPGGAMPESVREAIRRAVQVARARGIFVGAFCGGEDAAADMVDCGMDLVTPGNDISFLRDAANRRLSVIRRLTTLVSDASGY